MDKSNTNSQQSNIFVISSQSSNSNRNQNHQQKYIKFIKKIQILLDVQSNNLDHLYQRIEKIVKKYFHQHSIVEFTQMYDFLINLKSNSKKMNNVIAILQKRFARPQQDPNKNKFEKHQYFETTSTTQKQTKNSRNRQEFSVSNKQSFAERNSFNQPSNFISSSYNILKPSSLKERQISLHELTPKAKRSNVSEYSPSKYSASKVSPSKSNLSDQYYNRNRQYQKKIKQMMKQLQQIKTKISSNEGISASSLKLNLRQNGSYIEQIKKQQIQQDKIKQQININKQNKINEVNNFGSSYLNGLQENKSSNISSSNSFINQLSNIHSKYKIQNINQISNSSSQNSIKSTSIMAIMKNTENVSKQIEELKQVASKYQIDSNGSRNTENKQDSKNEIYPAQKINKLIKKVSQQKSKKQPILQQIQNAKSNVQITEQFIPSFKNLTENINKNPQKSINQQNSKQQISILINQQKSKPKPQINFNNLSSSKVVQSYYPIPQNTHNLNTIKYIYKPLPQPIQPNQSTFIKSQSYKEVPVFPSENSIPIKRVYINGQHQQNQIMMFPQNIQEITSQNLRNRNNSSMSMHPHLFNQSELVSNSRDPNQFLQNTPSFKKISPQITNSYIGSNNQNISNLRHSKSSNSIQRKGLNLISSATSDKF